MSTRAMDELAARFRAIDGRGYRAYKQVAGAYRFATFDLEFDHVQGDPFADPSRVTVRMPPEAAALPAEALRTAERRTSAADYLNRRLVESLERRAMDGGSGRSGELSILRPGQEVLRRTSMRVDADGAVEARLRAGLPGDGRKVLGEAAVELICHRLPEAVAEALRAPGLDPAALVQHVEAVEDAQALRAALPSLGLVAFVADGAILPRRSGVDERPLVGHGVIPFEAPDALRVTIETPNSGALSGMGIPEGVTLIAGGGFHGKSTLLRAVQRGVYDHRPGDGRERVVTRADAVKVRAEDGRAIRGTDISNFIQNLPGGEDTTRFTTANASGSTSQAAAIVEALELGCRCLLLDEDTSATNFLIRDARVQALVEKAAEPITPFIDRLAELRGQGVSVVLVVGGSGDFFDLADTVVAMRDYRPAEVTDAARAIARRLPSLRQVEGRPWTDLATRTPTPAEIQPRRGHRDPFVKAFSPHRLAFGPAELDLSALEQLVEAAQTRAIARTLAWARETSIDGTTPLPSALRHALDSTRAHGLDLIDDQRRGDYAEFRLHELAAVFNRLR